MFAGMNMMLHELHIFCKLVSFHHTGNDQLAFQRIRNQKQVEKSKKEGKQYKQEENCFTPSVLVSSGSLLSSIPLLSSC